MPRCLTVRPSEPPSVAAIFPPILQQAGAAAVRRDGGELGLRRERHLPDLAVCHETPRRHPLLLHATGPWRRRRLRVVARHCRRHEARHCAYDRLLQGGVHSSRQGDVRKHARRDRAHPGTDRSADFRSPEVVRIKRPCDRLRLGVTSDVDAESTEDVRPSGEGSRCRGHGGI